MATSIANSVGRGTPNFTVGGTRVFLPNYVITFIRPKPRAPPTHATFIVPLHFNKLDMRDYLWHAYAVGVRSVRSMVNQQALARRGVRGSGQVYRPRAQKMMTVELEQPFVWPDVPGEEALKDFDKGVFDTLRRARELQRKDQINKGTGVIPIRDQRRDVNREALAEQARNLLTGKEKWKGGSGGMEVD